MEVRETKQWRWGVWNIYSMGGECKVVEEEEEEEG